MRLFTLAWSKKTSTWAPYEQTDSQKILFTKKCVHVVVDYRLTRSQQSLLIDYTDTTMAMWTSSLNFGGL